MARKIGNYNENLSTIYNIISNNSLILKLLSYDNDTNVLDDVELTDEEKAKIRKKHIFNLKQIARTSTDNGVYISIEYDMVNRLKTRSIGNNGNPLMTSNYVSIFITCSQMLLDAANGNRVMSLEWAIEDALNNEGLLSLCKCKIGNSLPDRSVSGYYGRLIPLEFSDRNDGEWNKP